MKPFSSINYEIKITGWINSQLGVKLGNLHYKKNIFNFFLGSILVEILFYLLGFFTKGVKRDAGGEF